MDRMNSLRGFLKAWGWDEWANGLTDQKAGVTAPSVQLPCPKTTDCIDLVPAEDLSLGAIPLIDAIRARKSHRSFSGASLTLEELSFLLWAAQGICGTSEDGIGTLRTVPSGGGRHAFETYLAVNRVQGLAAGVYRYMPVDHKLCTLQIDSGIAKRVAAASRKNSFVGEGAVVFVWTVIPYRGEWRYGAVAHKMLAIDAGHVCQNLYLACTAVGAGACAVGAYSQGKMDELLGVDGESEFTIYVAPVGKIE